MTTITITNLFLASAMIAVCSFGAFLNFRYSQRNVYRRYLNSMLLFWAAVIGFVFFKFFINGNDTISYVTDFASVEVLLLGIPCFLSIVLYPIVILNASLLKPKNWRPLISPIAIPVAIYFAANLIAGLDPFIQYETAAEFFDNITSLSVISRLFLIFAFALYIIIVLVSIRRTVPVYNKYVYDNISDSDCNLEWIESLLIYISAVICCYFFMLFSNSTLVNTLYLSSILALFSYLVEMSLFRKITDDITALNLKFSLHRGGWKVESIELSETQPQVSITDIAIGRHMIDQWMNKEQPYLNVEFTTKDIHAKFPSIAHSTITAIFKSSDETFQAYVRRYRINHACEIIQQDNNKLYPKLLFNRVGFSHYSSFSRAFVAVTGYTPSEYMLLQRETYNKN
ncbi:MAG: helix-turn-helix domain-containing protein [Rikenellaceae bacterium]